MIISSIRGWEGHTIQWRPFLNDSSLSVSQNDVSAQIDVEAPTEIRGRHEGARYKRCITSNSSMCIISPLVSVGFPCQAQPPRRLVI